MCWKDGRGTAWAQKHPDPLDGAYGGTAAPSVVATATRGCEQARLFASLGAGWQARPTRKLCALGLPGRQ
jgi:hypothetical protein